jgi:hypothetical protein
MGEDGVFPYYGLDIIEEYNRVFTYEPWANKFKRALKRTMHPKIQFNLERIDKLLIMNPEWLPDEIIEQYKIEHVKLNRNSVQTVLNELTAIYKYKSNNAFNDVDIIFFDSDYSIRGVTTEQKEYDFLCNIFMQLRDKRIFVKLRPHSDDMINNKRIALYNMIQKKTACGMVIDAAESKYPWEIVYYNNYDALKDAVFVSESFSTAFVIPKKCFGSENNVIYLGKLRTPSRTASSAEARVEHLIERINKTFLSKRIYAPESFDEIRMALNA